MQNVPLSSCQVIKVNAGEWQNFQDELAMEEPLEIQLEYGREHNRRIKSISVTMRSPGNDIELALGFLYTEGIIRNYSDVHNVVCPDSNLVQVFLNEIIEPDLQKLERHFYTSSSCGVCGKSSIDAVHTISGHGKGGNDVIEVSTSLICHLPLILRERQNMFRQTGGIHASALFSIDGELLLISEDVGRHNALDKLIGAAFIQKILPIDKQILLLSGRASFELIQKAIMAGIPVVCAIGAPSTLAVQLAKEHGLTLVGFLREERFNIYAGKERIMGSDATSDQVNKK
jgi:FdhD protein